MSENNRTVVLTEPLLRDAMKGGIGLKKRQAEILGVSYPLASGWMADCLGKTLTNDQYNCLVELKNAKVKRPSKLERSILKNEASPKFLTY